MISKEEFYASLEERSGKEFVTNLINTKVAVCGLGGLGSSIATLLARAGIGKMCLVDFDRVELSNLNRQQFFVSQLGMFKAEALKETILKIAPFCETEIIIEKITPKNIKNIVFDSDIICEAFDNAESKAMLVNEISEIFPKKFIVSASGMAGMGDANDIKTLKIIENFYLCGDAISGVTSEISLVAPRVMICAAHQAHKVLQIISKRGM